MEVDLLTIFALIIGLVVGVLFGMLFTSQKKFWEGYEVSPTIYLYTVIMCCSIRVRKDESNGKGSAIIVKILGGEEEAGQ